MRKSKGLSQTLLAQKAQISLPYLNQIEKGRADSVSDDILKQIAAVLELSVEELKSNESGLKVGFSPNIWSIPLISMIINKPNIPVKLAYSHENNHSFENSRRIYFTDLEAQEVSNVVTITGKEIFKEESDVEVSFSMITEKDLQYGLNSQLYDLIFVPSVKNTYLNSLPIATICDTVKGGLYAIIFSNNAKNKGWTYDNVSDLEIIRKRKKEEFLYFYRENKSSWEDFVKKSTFYYQKDSIAEYIINEVIAKFKLHGNQRVEIKSDKIEDNVFIMSSILKSSFNNQKEKSNPNSVNQYLNLLGDAVTILTLPSIYILRQAIKAINESKLDDTYTVYIGWEPYVSKIRQQYEIDNPSNFCLMFNVNRFLDSDDSHVQINYECLMKNEKLENMKKNLEVKSFFSEIDSSIKRINQLAASESISPELDAIANILEMPSEKLQVLIKKINFSLKFYPNWVI